MLYVCDTYACNVKPRNYESADSATCKHLSTLIRVCSLQVAWTNRITTRLHTVTCLHYFTMSVTIVHYRINVYGLNVNNCLCWNLWRGISFNISKNVCIHSFCYKKIRQTKFCTSPHLFCLSNQLPQTHEVLTTRVSTTVWIDLCSYLGWRGS